MFCFRWTWKLHTCYDDANVTNTVLCAHLHIMTTPEESGNYVKWAKKAWNCQTKHIDFHWYVTLCFVTVPSSHNLDASNCKNFTFSVGKYSFIEYQHSELPFIYFKYFWTLVELANLSKIFEDATHCSFYQIRYVLQTFQSYHFNEVQKFVRIVISMTNVTL